MVAAPPPPFALWMIISRQLAFFPFSCSFLLHCHHTGFSNCSLLTDLRWILWDLYVR